MSQLHEFIKLYGWDFVLFASALGVVGYLFAWFLDYRTKQILKTWRPYEKA